MTFCSSTTSTFCFRGIYVRLHHLLCSFKTTDSFESIPTPRELLSSLELDVSWISITEVPATNWSPVALTASQRGFQCWSGGRGSCETRQKTHGQHGQVSASFKAATELTMPTVSAVANAKINYKSRTHTEDTHAHTGPQPHLPPSDSWLLNKDSGNVIKSFTFDSQPALKLMNSLRVCKNYIKWEHRDMEKKAALHSPSCSSTPPYFDVAALADTGSTELPGWPELVQRPGLHRHYPRFLGYCVCPSEQLWGGNITISRYLSDHL